MEHWYRIQSDLISAVICLALAINVLLRAWHNPVFRRFSAFNLNLSVLFLSDALLLSETLDGDIGVTARALCASLIPATAVSFFAGFSKEGSARAQLLRRLAWLMTLTTIAMVGAGWPSDVTTRSWIVFGAMATCLGLSMTQLGLRYQSLESRVERVRVKYVTGAGVVVFTLFLLEYLPTLEFSAAGNISMALYMFFMFQIVTRRRVMDIFEFLGRFVTLGGFSVVLGLIYVLLVGWWRHDLGLFVFNTAIASVVILILFDPLRASVEERLTQLVFREKFEFTRQAESLRGGLTKVIDVNALADTLLQHLERSRRVTHASIYLFDDDGLAYSLLGNIGSEVPERLDAITSRPFLDRLMVDKLVAVENLEAERAEILKREAAEDQGRVELLDAVIGTMQALESALSIALVSGEQLIGILNVRDERLREAYAADEIKALTALAGQATITIENSRLFDRIRERDRLAALGEMAAGLAHEIRNPLGAIKGAAQLLDEAASDRDTYLDIITEEVNRLNGVVSQFLTYARPLKTSGESVHINDVVERTLTLLKVEEHPCVIEYIQAPSLPTTRTDPELLRQVTLNLARNAIEAMGEDGGKLTVSTALTRRRPPRPSGSATRIDHITYIRVRFEDEGPGIAPEVIERLFIPFFTTKPSGTGLGLAICDRIIRAMGGWFDVKSKVGQGSQFTVYLPVNEPTRATTA